MSESFSGEQVHAKQMFEDDDTDKMAMLKLTKSQKTLLLARHRTRVEDGRSQDSDASLQDENMSSDQNPTSGGPTEATADRKAISLAKRGESLPLFVSSVIAAHASDADAVEIVTKCTEQQVTLETLMEAYRQDCLFPLLVRLRLPLGWCTLLMQGVADYQKGKPLTRQSAEYVI
jgi:hypothetical protein